MQNAAHTRWWQIGEVVFGVPLLLSVGLRFVVPLQILTGPLTIPRVLVGCVFCILGIALIATARREFSSHSQPTDPGKPTTTIVKTGVFSISRNPIYLGAVAFLLGVGLIANLTWELILLFPSAMLC